MGTLHPYFKGGMMKALWLGVVTVAIGAAIAALPTLGVQEAGGQPICVVAEAWAEANLATLPTTFEGVAALGTPYRKAAMRRITAADRVEIWGEQIRLFLEANPELTDEQVDFVTRIREILPEAMAMSLSKEQLNQFGKEAVELLGFDRAKAAFVAIGEPTWRSPTQPGPKLDTYGPEIMDECDCDDSGSMWCGINFECDEGSICDPSYFGCGFLGMEACLGMCEWAPEEDDS